MGEATTIGEAATMGEVAATVVKGDSRRIKGIREEGDGRGCNDGRVAATIVRVAVMKEEKADVSNLG